MGEDGELEVGSGVKTGIAGRGGAIPIFQNKYALTSGSYEGSESPESPDLITSLLDIRSYCQHRPIRYE